MATKAELAERAEAAKELRKLLRPGTTVLVKLNHVSKSGMRRVVDLYVVKGGDLRRITWSAAKALGWGYQRSPGGTEGLKLDGCGMDMGFHAVYTLSSVLYPKGARCIGRGKRHGDRCPSNDHSNERTEDYTPGRVHSDGGYALRHRWI